MALALTLDHHFNFFMMDKMLCNNNIVSVVGIGASAGGLEAIGQLVEALDDQLGLAYLVVSHLDPRHESLLPEILAKRTSLTVETAGEQVLKPNHIYVIPPDTALTLVGNQLHLQPRSLLRVKHLPIDILFESLAEQRPGAAVGIVLSGTGSDGAEGVKKIREAAGVTLVQTPASAAFPGMPQAAIDTGCVDLVMRPADIAAELARMARHPYFVKLEDNTGNEDTSPHSTMVKIFDLIRSVYQADFTQYKPNTIQRRLQRRMALVNETDVHSYLKVLKDNPVELAALYDDLLIRVTTFFREDSIYTALSETVFPMLLKERNHGDPVRIWVPACATGEEVYSLAISLLEYLGENAQDVTIQIFGTDLNEAAIEQARHGSYPESISDRVSAARLQRFFVHENRRYRVAKQVRELCVFARQNVALDPPFSRMDVISCCNLLIYLDSGLQRRVLKHFHYGLKPDGFLILGPAENADEEGQFFKRADSHQRMLYQRAMPTRGSLDLVLGGSTVDKRTSPVVDSSPPLSLDHTQVQRKADGLLLSRFSPASILVDDRMNIVQFRGQTSPYLEHASGTASLNLHRVAHPGILMQLVPLLNEVQASGRAVFKDDLRIETLNGMREGTVELIPLREPSTKTGFCLILFDANVRPTKPEGRPEIPETEKDIRIRQLEIELDSMRDYLQATNEAYEAALEESRSAQEELQSANEEFLSGNEELVIAREELQASNEELTTANEELMSRTRELSVMNTELARARKLADFNASYAESVIDTVAHPLVVLDQGLIIHRANHAFYDVFLTNPSDTLNRRLVDLGDGQWNSPELRKLLDQVVLGNSPITSYRVEHDFPGVGVKVMMVNARKVPAMDNRSARLLLAFEDVTVSDERLTRLRSDDHRKDEFIALLAHELRNPLAPIRNAVQLLTMKISDENLHRPLALIDRQVSTLARLINDLMDVSRITRGKMFFEQHPVNLNEAISQVISTIAPYMESRGHHLTALVPPTEVVVMGDATRLEQAIGNLLNNAGKYTDHGGYIEIALSVDHREAVISVSDNGVGIDANILPHIFDLFVQSDMTRTRAEGGLGIGLSLVRQITEAHGGTVVGHSNGSGTGTIFTMRLPISTSPVAESSGDTVDEENTVTFQARRILVVDDNADAANTVAELLRSWGHDVILAYDGFAALEVASTFTPEVALLDIGLPTMNGHELAVKLRQKISGKLFLIAVTGYGRPSDYKSSADSGFDVHLVKPISFGPLQVLLANLKSTDASAEG
ncbi:chemotaxis protein CheB [Undibacterium sp. Di27W]|uniref:chemotaxis protein CheB n=1 Tax=Undibacterium sp. Di27W TaxID=3413036 RepID=UPI003BF3EFD7